MVHPHDAALLNDLCDGRLGPAAADEVRRRLADERELSEAWDDLRRLRASLRALPAPAVPEGFLAAVRARAGLPPSVAEPTATSTGPISPDRGSEVSAGDARGARLLRLRPFMYAAAATLGVGLGVSLWYATNTVRTSESVVRSVAVEPKDASAPKWKAAEGAKAPSDGPAGEAPRYRAPGGAVPSGLRAPSDEPGPAPAGHGTARADAAMADAATGSAPSMDEARATPPSGARRGAPSPVPAPAAPPPPAATPPAPPDAPPPVTVPPSPSEGPSSRPATPAVPTPPPTPAARADGEGHEEKDRPEPPAPAEKAVPTGGTALSWAAEGVDEVLVLRADSLDAARAEVALIQRGLRADEREGALRKSTRLARLADLEAFEAEGDRGDASPDVDHDASQPSGAPKPDPAPAPAPAAPPPPRPSLPGTSGGGGAGVPRRPDPAAKAPVAPVAPAVLGSIVLELSEAEWALVEATLPRPASESETRKGERARVAKEAGAAHGDTKDKVGAPPAGATEPGMDAGESEGAKAAKPGDAEKAPAPPRRLLRILVVAR